MFTIRHLEILAVFFLFESVCDFSTSMSPLSDHEMWLPLVYFCFFLLCFVFLLSSSVFCGYFGNMALWVPPGDYDREGFMNTIETRFPNSKEETRLSCYSD